jgi:hypothetical protein
MHLEAMSDATDHRCDATKGALFISSPPPPKRSTARRPPGSSSSFRRGAIFHKLSPAESILINKLFKAIDKSKDGYLQREELGMLFESPTHGPEFRRIFEVRVYEYNVQRVRPIPSYVPSFILLANNVV